MSRLIDADALCRTISLHIMAYKKLLTNKITIPSQIDREKVNSIIDGFRECIDIVYYEPRVIAEPILHGHWIGIDDEPCETYECDKCGYITEDIGCNYGIPNHFKYCPHCGAKMEEVAEDE